MDPEKDQTQQVPLVPNSRKVNKNQSVPIKNTILTESSKQLPENDQELQESSSDFDDGTIGNKMVNNNIQSMQSMSDNQTVSKDIKMGRNELSLPLIQNVTEKSGPKEDKDSSNDENEYFEKVKNLIENDKGQLPNQKAHPQGGKDGWKALTELDSLPLMKRGYSLEADMKFGWKPQVKGKVLPIPFVFDSEDHLFNLPHYADIAMKKKQPVIYQGWRPADSFKMYRKILANNHPYHGSDFQFKVPSELPPAIQKLIDQQMQTQVLGGTRGSIEKEPRFEGMNPEHQSLYDTGKVLQFDSMFECGNLDRVIMVSPTEYDLYMRPDTNTRGHHQWFYFRAKSSSNLGAVRFNILNFTKQSSLHDQGMKICICCSHDKIQAISQAELSKTKKFDTDSAGWKRGGYDIVYQGSKLNNIVQKQSEKDSEFSTDGGVTKYRPFFHQMSFTYDFDYMEGEETYFAHSFPYTFTRLSRFIKELKRDPEIMQYTKDPGPICHSLSGVDVPFLIVTTRAHQEDYNLIDPDEHSKESLPEDKSKRTVILTARVHPGETNASFMMEGFINFITNKTDPMAIELRKRLVFKILPCVNPDGVMAGNYRVSMSGNDLNRRYLNPHPKLHPIVCAVKKLIKEERPDLQARGENPILAFIDMHGHSRKKNVFMYGPEYPIHDGKYIQMRVLPKLMSEQTEMFRFYSCKFRIQASKEKTARVVLWRDFNIMNCFTLEASLHGYFDSTRDTADFVHSHFFKIGKILGKSLFEYMIMKEEDEKAIRIRREEAKKQKIKIQQQLKKKKTEVSKEKAILSPSASSEAITNIDDQQPTEKTKINQIRKKLLNAQKSQEKSKGVNLIQSSGKKKFKLTKKFKDDMPPLAPKKAAANPMEPPEEAEAETCQANPNEDEPEKDVNDQFLTQFRMNKRTMKDLCQQIETEEKVVRPDSQEEGYISEGGQMMLPVCTENDQINESGSEDDLLLQKIQGNILGILKSEFPVPISEKKKTKKLHDSSQKKIPKNQIAFPKDALVIPPKPGKEQLKKPSSESKSAHGKKQLVQVSIVAQKKNGERKSSGQGLKRDDSQRQIWRRQDKKQKQEPQIDPKFQLGGAPPTQSGQGQVLQMNYNNFNDRIITQSYNKHKKNVQYGAGYHLSTLSANAQQLLQHQLQQEQAKRQQILDAQQRALMQKEIDDKNYAIYNFQGRREAKNEPMMVESYRPPDSYQNLPGSQIMQIQMNPNENRYKLTSKQYNKRQHLEANNIDEISSKPNFRRDAMGMGPPAFNFANSQVQSKESIFLYPEIGMANSQLNLNRGSQQNIKSVVAYPTQGQLDISQQSEAPFKKRNRRIVDSHQQQPIIESSKNRLIQISPNKISHQVSQNNVKQSYLFLKPTQNMVIDEEIDRQVAADVSLLIQENNLQVPSIIIPQEPSSAGPKTQSELRSGRKQYQLIQAQIQENQNGRQSAAHKMTEALSQSRENQNFNNDEAAQKIRGQFDAFYPTGTNEAYGLKHNQIQQSPQNYNNAKFSNFIHVHSEQKGRAFAQGTPLKSREPKIGKQNVMIRNTKPNIGYEAPSMAFPNVQLTTPSEFPQVQVPTDKDHGRKTEQQQYFDLRAPQKPTSTPTQKKSESAQKQRRQQIGTNPKIQHLVKTDNQEYFHQFGDKSVPHFDQMIELSRQNLGKSQPQTMKGSTKYYSQTVQKAARNQNNFIKDAPIFHTRQLQSDDNNSKEALEYNIRISNRNGKSMEKAKKMKLQQDVFEGLKELSRELNQESNQNYDFKVHDNSPAHEHIQQQFAKVSPKKIKELNLAQKEMQKNLFTMDHRRVNYIKSQIRNQQELYNQQQWGQIVDSPRKKEMNIQQ